MEFDAYLLGTIRYLGNLYSASYTIVMCYFISNKEGLLEILNTERRFWPKFPSEILWKLAMIAQF